MEQEQEKGEASRVAPGAEGTGDCRREVKKPFWHIAVYLKIKFTPNLRRQLAAFSFVSTPPEVFSVATS